MTITPKLCGFAETDIDRRAEYVRERALNGPGEFELCH